MIEAAVLGVFGLALILSLSCAGSVLPALLFGFFLFSGYSLRTRHTARDTLAMALSGVSSVRTLLVIFVLIGAITAAWRAGGTLAVLIYNASALCSPRWMVLASFLLTAAVSFLTGTSFGTAATMGVVCAVMGESMGVPAVYTGGAVLAGAFFGDRCSPMSSTCLLVATLTRTELYGNLAILLRTGLVPFLVSAGAYALVGFTFPVHPDASGVRQMLAASFSLSLLTALPAGAVILLAALRVSIQKAMGASILTGAACALLFEGMTPAALLSAIVFGYEPASSGAALLAGGGILSMAEVFAIVCLSASYAGLFAGTGLLSGFHAALVRASRTLHPYGAVLVTAIATSLIACNQALPLVLTHQLCRDLVPDGRRMMSYLQNTAGVIPPLVPWSISAAVPLASIGAPLSAIPAAWYLWLLPLWNYVLAVREDRRTTGPAK